MKYLFFAIFAIFVMASLMPIICYHPGWNLDDSVWIMRMFKYEPFKFLLEQYNPIIAASDRYFPLYQLDVQVLSFATTNPTYIFFYKYILALCSLSIMSLLLFKNIKSSSIYYVLLLLGTPSFVTSFYRLPPHESTLLILWTLYIFLQVYKFSIPYKWVRWFSLIPLNIALYMKETSFIIPLVMSIGGIFLYYRYFKTRKSGQVSMFGNDIKLYYLSLGSVLLHNIQMGIVIISSGFAEGSYHSVITPDSHGFIYYLSRNITLYTLSDPIIIFVLPAIMIYANYRIYSHGSFHAGYNIEMSTMNVISITAIFFMLSYIFLGIHSTHYLLPVYPFAILSISGYLDILKRLPKVNVVYRSNHYRIKVVLVLFGIILLLNSAAISINEILYTRTKSLNYTRYSEYLINYLEDHRPKNRNELIKIYTPGKRLNPASYSARMIINMLGMSAGSNYDNDIYNDNWQLPMQIKGNDQIDLSFGYDYLSGNGIKEIEEESYESGDLLMLLPDTDISHEDIMSNFRKIKTRYLLKSCDELYQLPELSVLVKYVILKFSPKMINTSLNYRHACFSIVKIE